MIVLLAAFFCDPIIQYAKLCTKLVSALGKSYQRPA
jgi:hypothetical protein